MTSVESREQKSVEDATPVAAVEIQDEAVGAAVAAAITESDHKDHEEVEEDDSSAATSSDDDAADDDYDVSSTDSEESERGRRRRATQESAINSAARKIMQDPRKRQEVRQRLDDLLAQASAYSEFITEMLDAEEEEQQRREVEALSQLDAEASAATATASTADGAANVEGSADGTLMPTTAVRTVAAAAPVAEPLGAAYRPTKDGATLMSHQRRGIAWLTGLYQNGVNGILADEMGLGKTVQVIGFIARLCYERLVGPHLIVAPLATLPNWRREFARWAPDVRVFFLHGHSRDYAAKFEEIRTQLRPPYTQSEKMGPSTALELMRSRGGVVLTSFEVALRFKDEIAGMPAYWEAEAHSEYKARKKAARRRERDDGAEAAAGSSKKKAAQKDEGGEPPLASASFKWGILVVDEAHRMKNFECELIRALRAVPTSARLLLTGTPLQNRISELWSILNFVAPELFESVAEFQIWFSVSAALVDDAAAADESEAQAAAQAAVAEKTGDAAIAGRQKRSGPKKDELSAELADLTLAANVADAAAAGGAALSRDTSRVAEEYYAVAKMHSVLRPFLLRRTKAILTELRLPPKYEVVVRCPLAPFQARAYNTVVCDTKNFRMNRLAQLRNCCIHPYLVSNILFERWAEQAALYLATEERKGAKAREASKQAQLQRAREKRQLAAVNRKIIAAQNAAAAAAAAAADTGVTTIVAADAQQPPPAIKPTGKRGSGKTTATAATATPTAADLPAKEVKMAKEAATAGDDASAEADEFLPSDILFATNPSVRAQYLRDLRMDSTKIDAAIRLLPQLVAAGHHCLVFSQFTRTLDIMEELLRAYNRGEPLGDALFDPPLPKISTSEKLKKKTMAPDAADEKEEMVPTSRRGKIDTAAARKKAKKAGSDGENDAAPAGKKTNKTAAKAAKDDAASKKPAPKPKRTRRAEIETSSSSGSDSEDGFVGFPEASAEERAKYEAECKLRAAIRHGTAPVAGSQGDSGKGCRGKKSTPATLPLPVPLAGLPFGRIDGGNADSETRQATIDAFTLQPSPDAPRVLLISTRAGGVGLNLARADTVLMLDADFNPHNDLQAIDRCHRIGQRRPALVMRFISVGTVEEAIWDCCTHKLRLEALVIGCGRLNDKNAAMASDGGGKAGTSSAAALVPSPTPACDGAEGSAEAEDPEQQQRREIEGIREALTRLRSMQLTELSVARGNLLTDPTPPPTQTDPPSSAGEALGGSVDEAPELSADDEPHHQPGGVLTPEFDESGLPIGVLCRSGAGGFHFTVNSRSVGRGLESLVDFPR